MHSSYDLTLEEQKIILTLASMVRPEDEEFKLYKFKIGDFIKLLGIKNKSKYKSIPKVTKELMKKVFEIEEDTKLIQISWLSSVVYDKGLGYVELEFSPRLKPYMLKLNSMFTQYKLSNVLKMKSKYSPRIYELLKCNEYKKQGYTEISVLDLRHLLKIEDIYPLYADFKKKVIVQSQKELEKLTDIKFEFEEVKTSRKVTSIKFYIHANNQNEVTNVSEDTSAIGMDIDDLVDQLQTFISEPIKIRDLKAILKAADNDVKLIQAKYELAKQQSHIENLTAWLISAVKDDYTEPVSRTKKNKFVNYEQENYDFDKLEQLERERIKKNLESSRVDNFDIQSILSELN